MKKVICTLMIFLVAILATIAVISINKRDNNTLKKITVAEVAHSVFYAPQYAADALGYFEPVAICCDVFCAALFTLLSVLSEWFTPPKVIAIANHQSFLP